MGRCGTVRVSSALDLLLCIDYRVAGVRYCSFYRLLLLCWLLSFAHLSLRDRRSAMGKFVQRGYCSSISLSPFSSLRVSISLSLSPRVYTRLTSPFYRFMCCVCRALAVTVAFIFVLVLPAGDATSQGLRAYLRAAIQYTYSKAVCPYVVHELSDVPYLHGDFFQQPEPFDVNIPRDSMYVCYASLIFQMQHSNMRYCFHIRQSYLARWIDRKPGVRVMCTMMTLIL